MIRAALVAGLLAVPVCAAAQGDCAPRADVVARLTGKYGETRRAIGLGTHNTMVEVFASDDTGSWTILVTNALGVACLVASGQAFESITTPAPVEGDPT